MPTQPNVKSEGKEVYRAEVGTPLQKALVDNFEAQKQLEEAMLKVIQSTREETVREVMLDRKRGIETKFRGNDDFDSSWCEECNSYEDCDCTGFNKCLSEIKDRAHKLWGIRV